MADDPRPLALLVSPVLPRPDGCGRALRAWDWVDTLARDARVHVVVTAPRPPDPRDPPAARWDRIWWIDVATAPRARLGSRIFSLLAGRRGSAPDWRSLRAGGLPAGLVEAITEQGVSRIVVFRVYLHDIGDAIATLAPLAVRDLDFDDLESATRLSIAACHLRMREYRRALDGIVAAWRYRRIVNGLGGYRAAFLAAREDRARVPAGVAQTVLCRPNRIAPVPRPAIAPGPRRLLFVGTLNYPPNREAARFLARRLVPRLRRDAGDLRVTIVGRSIPRRLRDLLAATDGLDYAGEVAALGGYYQESLAALVPVWAGGGTKLKTIEAMAHGVPVVSTRHGVRGLGAVAGEHYLHAETASGFLAAIVALANDPALALRIATNGKRLFERCFRAPAGDERSPAVDTGGGRDREAV